MESILMFNTKWLYPKSREVSRKQTHQCAPHTMFYKIVYGLVAILLPSYFVHPEVYTRHMHSLSRSYRQIHISVCYYQYSFFPLLVVLLNKLPADLVIVSDLDSFKTGVSGVSEINHVNP